MADSTPELHVGMARTPCSMNEARRAGVELVNPDSLPEVIVHNVWVTVAIDAAWTSAYRLAVQDGRLVVGELRVYPTPTKNPLSPKARQQGQTAGMNPWNPGEWAGMLQGISATVPQYGLTSTVLKAVRLGADITGGRAILDDLAQRATGKNAPAWIRQTLKTWGVTTSAKPASRDTGRRGLPHQEYERVVRAYLRAVADGSPRPVQDAAKTLGISAAKVRDRLHRARLMGLLPSGGQGRVVGGLVAPRTGKRR